MLAKIAWHPGYVAAVGIELKDERNLRMISEKNLSKEPIRIDLYIQTDGKEKLQNNIGHLFRKYNVIEYKSPEDSLSVDDYFKTIGYACLLKGLGKTVDEYPEDEITVSIFRDSYPRGLFSYLQKTGRIIEEKYNGIYYVTGNVLFPTQIVVTSRLDKTYSSLRILSKHAREDDARRFVEKARKMTAPGDRNNCDAVLQVSISANKELYERLKGDPNMCEALKELLKDEWDKELTKERIRVRELMKDELAIKEQQDIEKGIATGEELTIIEQVLKKLKKSYSIDQIADHLEINVEKIQRIVDVAKKYAPGYDKQLIFAELNR